MAIENNHIDIVQTLLEYGANINEVDNDFIDD